MIAAPPRPRVVLFDRDGTLVRDVPFNGDPALVEPVPGARPALDRLRRAGIRVGVVSNQSGVARGLLTTADVDAVNARIADLLGPFDVFLYCSHGPADGCACRKPAPGLIVDAARRLGVSPGECVVIGDIGSDVDAARAAGARAILVPTPATRGEETAAATEVAADLTAAVDLVLHRRTVLVARLDNDGDVLLAGPAIRAVAASGARVVLLCGPRGEQAARLLPGVVELEVWRCPWIDPAPPPVDRTDVLATAERIRTHRPDQALVLTSFHQSPLPTALLLRLAGVPWIGATSEDYPGSLLDLRHRLPEGGLHEAERMLALATAAGFELPPGDEGALAVRRPLPDTADLTGDGPYVVVHPGASVPARAATPERCAAIVTALLDAGHRVVVTGSPAERTLTAAVAGSGGLDLGGATTLGELADVLDRAEAVVVANTGPAHLAAAVGTPVVSLFAPTVPVERWRPWRVPHVLLGDQHAGCAGSRATRCPIPGHPCLDVDPRAVVAAVTRLAEAREPGTRQPGTRQPGTQQSGTRRPALERSA